MRPQSYLCLCYSAIYYYFENEVLQ
uniref:Uncharacterized protein n=1 Tax=Arundo donax TaxID=35708 RepID=A0A0A9BFQ7_ARUDO